MEFPDKQLEQDSVNCFFLASVSSVGETEPLIWERYIENLYLHLSSEDII